MMSWFDRCVYRLTWSLIKLFDKFFFHIEFQGKENLPRSGGYILACNHLSYMDPVIVSQAQYRPFTFLARDTLFKHKVFGFYISRLGAISIKREASDFRALRATLKRLAQGSPVVLFPEGTRLGDDKNAQPGIGFLAIKSKVPVIPAYIQGSDKVLPPGAKWFHRHPIKVYLGKPVRFTEGKDYSEIAQEIMDSIRALAPQGNFS